MSKLEKSVQKIWWEERTGKVVEVANRGLCDARKAASNGMIESTHGKECTKLVELVELDDLMELYQVCISRKV
jgi:hypothetical protein